MFTRTMVKSNGLFGGILYLINVLFFTNYFKNVSNNDNLPHKDSKNVEFCKHF